jgi:putative tryptophan/tyrosine transport system substrate-binding protein
MRRREFITLVGGAAATLGPGIARAQQPAMPVIGYLAPQLSLEPGPRLNDIRGGLSETGYVEGRNLAIEYRWAEYRLERLPALAADLVRRRVALIIAPSTPSALAAKAETDSIPIVFQIAGDPVRTGLVASLNRPGGNLTGISNLFTEAAGKRLELLKEVVPAVLSMALLTNLTNPVFAEREASELQAAARILGVRLLVLSASHPSEIEAAFATVARDGTGALLIGGDTVFFSGRDQLVALAARYKIPTMYPSLAHTAAGGLMSYGTKFSEAFRQVGVYAGRILNGEKPADLPVQLITKMELGINMKTAQELGLTIPPTLLARADEVIE